MSEENEYTGVYFDFLNEWSQVVGKYNWIIFTPIMLEFENDITMGGLEMTVMVLGVGFRIRWNHTLTKQSDEIIKRAKEITDNPDTLNKDK